MRALLLTVGVASSTAGHPIEKVISLIKDLREKAVEEGQAEEVAYTKFSRWCKNSVSTLKGQIQKAENTLAEAAEAKESQTQMAAKMEKQMAEIDTDLTRRNAAQTSADEARSEENKEYVAAQQELTATITALTEAITDLKAGKTKVTTDTALAAIRSKLTPLEDVMTEHQRGLVAALLQVPDKPEAKKYAFKGDKIIELLEALKDDFQKKKFESEKGEINSKNSYDLASQAQGQAIAAANASKGKKSTRKTSAETDLAATETTISTASGDLSTAKDTLDETEKTCDRRAQEWSERTATRSDEMKAMDTAIAILKKSSGVRAPKEAEPEESFAQLQTVARHDAPGALEASVSLLKNVEATYKSRDLAAVVSAVEALQPYKGSHTDKAKGPFHKVNQMIQKMIFRLQEEQKAEAEHKHWCDNEVTQNSAKKEEFMGREDKLTINIDGMTAQIGQLDTQVGEAADNIKGIEASMEQLRLDREADHKDNLQDVKDAEQAQKSIADAVAVLEDFYRKSGAINEAFLQPRERALLQDLPKEPDTWENSYSGESASQKILDMLEHVGADFARMESEARAEEDQNARDFDKTLEDLTVQLAHEKESKRLKEKSINRLEEKLSKKGQQLEDAKDQLYAAKVYRESLQQSCFGDATDYEAVKTAFSARQDARTKEINALRDAQKTLKEAFSDNAAEASAPAAAP
mmetsp:Transcript_52303/g.114830  ORF Transcript_52303/g.114830 Transcript_52303/m.114830 type:complete len:695 (-) Transcript_52303:89-2173(-)